MTVSRSEPTAPSDDVSTATWLRARIRSRLGIDTRALGAFRIGLGLVILLDRLVLRVPGLATFYTDAGILPRSTLAELSVRYVYWLAVVPPAANVGSR